MLFRTFYTVLLYVLLPAILIRMWLRGAKSPEYRRRWNERLGLVRYPKNRKNGVMFHCVSVGETLAAIPLIKQLQAEHPELPITVTTTTPTGSERVKSALKDSVYHCYLPYDLPLPLQHLFSSLKPKTLVILETELWPNLLHVAKFNGCKTILANARLSPKSAKGYGNFRGLTKNVLLAPLDCVAAHHESDGERFIELGLAPEKLNVTGSIKFDIKVPDNIDEKRVELRSKWRTDKPIVIAASTHQSEEEKIIQSWQQLNQRLVKLDAEPSILLVVPRHPERFQDVAELLEQNGLNYITRSSGQELAADTQVILGDTMGELLLLYSIATVAFVGGSLVEVGGHNPLEPAALGIPVVSGPIVTNFKQIYRMMEEQNAVTIATDTQDLSKQLASLLMNPFTRQQMGENGMQVVETNRGAMQKLLELITNSIEETDSEKQS